MEKTLRDKIQELLPPNAVVLLGVVEGERKADMETIISEIGDTDEMKEKYTRVLTLAFTGAMTKMGTAKDLSEFAMIGGKVTGLLTELQDAEKEDDNG